VKRLSGSKRVLFVCAGNTCRSPMAEAIARQILGPTADVQSAGICADEGASATQDAIAVMEERERMQRAVRLLMILMRSLPQGPKGLRSAPYGPVSQDPFQVQAHIHVELPFLIAASLDRHPADEDRVVALPEALGEPRSPLVEADDIHSLGSRLPVPVRLVLQSRDAAVEAPGAGLPQRGVFRQPTFEDELVVPAGGGMRNAGNGAGGRVRTGPLCLVRRAGPIAAGRRQ
jgi:hypothetical protein